MNERKHPDWSDSELSDEIAMIAAIGETQEVEFKATMPQQVSNLAKEIAGFATSNAGRVIIGIEDDGTIRGLDQFDRAARAKLTERIEGLCANAVQPSITPTLKYAVVDDKAVLAIEVPKGSAPVYYSANIPYLRQMTSARPMAPNEVVEHIVAWHKASTENPRQTAESRFLSELAEFLVDADVTAREARIRTLKPWSDLLRSSAGYLARRARELAAGAPNELIETAEPLEEIADAFDIVAHERTALNRSRAPLIGAIDTVLETIDKIRPRWLPHEVFGEETEVNQREQIEKISRQLAGLVGRATERERFLRTQEILDEAAGYGDTLARVASAGVALGGTERVEKLRSIAESIRELETRRLPMDGGASIDRMINDLGQESENLKNWIEEFGLP
ncbi:putative DNA binding domain-containing protein [Erythrobacteraceae bacterium E2-1 Yellow Sea]|jgi:hypothetical protein|nr:putative DNA binding domain-containing protein [Erythrobacteraceae bacterium E2-1 Yellow Sea]